MKRHRLILTAMTFFALCMVAFTAETMAQHPPLGGGNGTSADPYQIADTVQLRTFSDWVNADNGPATAGVYYRLMNNLDLGGYANWTPIGTATGVSKVFLGNFDGNGKIISNLKTYIEWDYAGLFGYISDGALIENLGIENCDVTGWAAGALVAEARGSSSLGVVIRNCYSTGSVKHTYDDGSAGGLVYSVAYGSISNCYSTCDVSGLHPDGSNMGGLFGSVDNTTIEYCYATGSVSGNNGVGGLVYNASESTIKNCIAANDSLSISTTGIYINRIAGHNYNSTFLRNYALNTMSVTDGSGAVSITDGTNLAGTAKTLSELQSLSFYTTAGNWNTTAWDIANPASVWKICVDEGMPSLRWQGILCSYDTSFFCGGTGTATDPYQICTPAGLKTFANWVNAGNGPATAGVYYRLMNDLDLSSYDNWTPVAAGTNVFLGKFDGNGKIISNLKTYREWDYAGLFGFVDSGALIENLGIENCDITGRNGGALAGIIEGSSSLSAVIRNCYSTGSVKSTFDDGGAGGLLGYVKYASISNCYSACDVSGLHPDANALGGLISIAEHATVEYCYTTGSISGSSSIGGLAGNAYYSTFKNCVAANDSLSISTTGTYINRIAGYNHNSTFLNNYALDAMSVTDGDGAVSITDGADLAGTAKTLPELQSLSFYTTAGNWNTAVWDIANPASVWKICEADLTYPFLRWQGILCSDDISFFCGGTGTETDPYQICTPAELKAFTDWVNAGNGPATAGVYYRLMNDLDLSSDTNWTPISGTGYIVNAFKGNFDGNGKIISNLKMTYENDYAGLFGDIGAGALIENLGIENCDVTGWIAGALVADARGSSSLGVIIRNCYSTGTVKSTYDDGGAGGLLGYVQYASISNCYSACDVSGLDPDANNLGGLISIAEHATVEYCYATGSVSGNTYIGGLAGSINFSTVKNCIAANDSLSILATGSYAYVNRIAASGHNSTFLNNYALDVMSVTDGDGTVSITDGADLAGTAKTLSELQSLSFYTTAGNWNTAVWDIDNPAGIWKICEADLTYPFLRWQGILCSDGATYTITATAGANGKITPSGAVNVPEGDNKTFTFSANSDYEIYQVLIDSTNNPAAVAAGSYTFEDVTANHSIHVTFKTIGSTIHTITATAGANGTISPSGTIPVEEGEEQTFTFTANSGYRIDQVLIDGTNNFAAVTAGSYTFSNVTADHTINVSFRAITGISEVSASSISIYPNPTDGKLFIESGDLHMEKVEVLDITGRTVLTSHETEINISHLSAGTYFVKLKTDKGRVVKKVVKE